MFRALREKLNAASAAAKAKPIEDISEVVGDSGRRLKQGALDDVLEGLQLELLEADVALSVAEELTDNVRAYLAGRRMDRSFRMDEGISLAFRSAVKAILDKHVFSLEEAIEGKSRPIVMMFVGINGTGKTTAIAKLAHRFQKRGHSCVLAAADTPRLEVPQAIAQARSLGIKQVEILTGDNQGAAASLLAWLEAELGGEIALGCRANLLPEEKIEIVKSYQARGHTVVMVGDGVNDAPALAQADVGIAMGGSNGGVGSGVAMEAAHITLMREDWALVPEALRIADRTMRVVRMNIFFTTLYNFAGLSLAALGFLPPILAAAAQSLPDLGILANSSRLLRQGKD